VGMFITIYLVWRNPLKVSRVVVKKYPDEEGKSDKYYIVINNRKPYPVTINSVVCYEHRMYKVELVKSEMLPTVTPELQVDKKLIKTICKFEISANGQSVVEAYDGKVSTFLKNYIKVKRLLFAVNTSHGYYELWCSNIVVEKMGVGEMYSVDYYEDFESKLGAEIQRLKLIVKALKKRIKRNE